MKLSKLPHNWILTSVREIASPENGSCVTGPFGSSIGKIYWIKNGIPVIRGNNIVTKGPKFIDNGYVFITEEYANTKMKRYHAVKDDIIFTAAGTIGQVGIIPQTSKYPYYIISNKQMRLRVDKNKVDPYFAFYYFRTKYVYTLIQQNNTGSTIPLINLTVLKNLPFVLAPLPTQHRIAEILSALDDKIELNLQMNKTLEEMAMALYKHWFVDFGPFKDGEFVDSELGLIPKVWKVKRLKEIAKITMGQSPLSKFYNKEQNGLPFHQGVKDYGDRFPTDVIYSTDGNRIAEENDILFSVRAPVGKINIAKNKIILGRGLASLTLKQFGNNFLYYSLRNQFKEIDTFGDGTVYKSVSKRDIENIKLVFPSIDMLSKFNDFVSHLDKQIKLNYFENQSLQRTRDYLLPKLISGEVEVKEINKIIIL